MTNSMNGSSKESPIKIIEDMFEEKKMEQKPKTKVMTARKIKILAAVIYGNLFLGSCYSLMAPIFPAEAEKKQASATAYGFVFGVYQIIMFLASPIYGKIIIILKPGFMMKAGMFVSGVCVILFGFLQYAPPGPSFIALAVVIRSVDALGAAAFLTASYTTLGSELPEIIGRAMSLTETAFAFGLAGGPVLGGLLYEVGGFSLPFNVVGALLLTGTVVNLFLFSDEGGVSAKPFSARKLLSNPDFLIDAIVISTCFAVLGFNEATLEPHVRQFQLSPTIIGVIFLIGGIVDALSSPLWGYCAEKVKNAHYLTFIACLLFITCFLIVGPVPFLPFVTNLTAVIISQFFLGLAMAGQIVCSFTHGMKHTVQRGFPDDVGTYGLVSGVLFSVACFGAFVGPSLGGFLIDNVGYKIATSIIVATEIVVAIICAVRLIILHIRQNSKETSSMILDIK
ncbi:MFS-type transporter SLC18B1-like [Uloborus diversus]|uniref:MFS-type transporter SLC18B1-like n=1 Tax=Uloborus diversus TaxID=327109 RepID=UPI002409B367|nr:MFS-type transporter SLC18B1-like [Uloborus diversus]